MTPTNEKLPAPDSGWIVFTGRGARGDENPDAPRFWLRPSGAVVFNAAGKGLLGDHLHLMYNVAERQLGLRSVSAETPGARRVGTVTGRWGKPTYAVNIMLLARKYQLSLHYLQIGHWLQRSDIIVLQLEDKIVDHLDEDARFRDYDPFPGVG